MEKYGDVIEKICKTELFSDIDKEVLSSFFTGSEKTEKYKNADMIYSSEKYENAIGFIVKGRAMVINKDSKVIVGNLSEGSIFGFQSLFLSPSYFTNEIIAVGDTKVFYIEKDAISLLLKSEPEFALNYIRYLSKRIYFLNSRIESFTGGTAEQRLANYLCSKFDFSDLFIMDMPLNQLAVSLDIGRASLYRAFDKLIGSNAVERNGKEIRLINKETLMSYLK